MRALIVRLNLPDLLGNVDDFERMSGVLFNNSTLTSQQKSFGKLNNPRHSIQSICSEFACHKGFFRNFKWCSYAKTTCRHITKTRVVTWMTD